ncbi:hypothetical protein HME9304_00267 [Flagellimonas maritima]|uniref:RHS repeat-associated core domain-containing protein n=1 Tax=Flagellimonas maritima TaxID=1383885 RepID=A0A2Z4LNE6_9FLAO|nr:hypothetical protein [Allomuricauda aurantiaca]AWX43280.1 hypothetical protein HME9304_00267 [Allomuricauda aurantiaca]
MNIKTTITLILLFAAKTCLAQDLPKITPPSPEATALAKFTEIPVSHYTGVPSISIPIHTIQQNGISIPISLNYHSRGIKVGEIAPRYGLGWALQYGGSISRQTRGGTDESQYGYLNNNYDMDFFTDANKRGDVQDTYTFNQEYDFTPDLFHFNANGIGGKFIIDKTDGEVLVQGFDDIDITYLNQSVGNFNGIQSFTITDKHGNKFYFGVSKNGIRTARNYDKPIRSSHIPMGGGRQDFGFSGENYFNSWQLMEIETTYGHMIEFHYGSEEISRTFRHSYDKLENNVPVHHSLELEIHQFQLSEIRFNKGKLMFQSGAERDDLQDSHMLDKISLYDKQDNLIKSYELDYIYTTSIVDNNVHDFLEAQEPRANKRLFLNSIQETAPNLEQLPPYLFEYSTEQLPNRFSTSQDLWGYFNGKNNGQHLTFFDYGNVNIDRTVDVVKSEAGLLKKITYPTNGSSAFVYEDNIALTPLEFGQLVFQNVNPLIKKGVALSQISYSQYYNTNTNEYVHPFTIGPGIVGAISSFVRFNSPDQCSSSEFIQGCKFRVYVQGNGTAFELFIGKNDNHFNLAPGNYELIVEPRGTHDPLDPENDGFAVYLDWFEEADNSDDVVYGGGKRVKRILMDDAHGTIQTKEYEYLDLFGRSTGRIFGLPNFYSISDYSVGQFTILDAFGAVPGSPLGTPQGNSVGYSKVTEYYGSITANSGKTEYEFSVIPDAGKYYEFPYPLPTDNEWLRGKILKTEMFRKDPLDYTLLQKTENTYLYGDILANYPLPPPVFNPGSYSTYCNNDSNPGYSKNQRRYHLPLIQFINPGDITCQNGGNLAYDTYYLTGGTLDLGRSVATSYFDNGRELTTTKDYFYNYDDHYQLGSTQTRDSEGLTRMTKMYYWTDVNDTELGNRHRYSDIVKQENFLDKNDDGIFQPSELIGKQETDYRLWTNANNQYLPEYIKAQKGSGPLENRIIYHDYDDYGNPLQVSKPNGQNISYIWGYNNQYPVAKIENANRTEIDALSGFGTDFDSGTGGLTSIQENRLRSDLPKAIITTYSYSPLIGLKSVTNPMEDSTKYSYDQFNRLKQVKDRNDKVISEYTHKYKN